MNPGPRPQAFEPEGVEWRPSSPDAIEVRVAGAWHGATVPPAAMLVVEGFGRFAAVSGSVSVDRPPAWSAAFAVPIEARAAVEAASGMTLELGEVAVPLPAGVPGRVRPEPPGATVVDPEVFAERRARREEAAEETAVERAATAEDAAATLRIQIEHLEERLARASGERDALAARVADAERRLRLAEQREEAERRGRAELEEEASVARRAAQRALDELREELTTAAEAADVAERERDEALRRLAVAEQARAKVEAELASALERVAELEGTAGSEAEALRREAAALEARMEEARAERARLEADDAALEAARAESGELRRRLAEVEARLVEEVAAREGAELRAAQASPSRREQALAEQVASLQEELDRRGATQARVQQAIDAVREELVAVRAQVEATRTGGSTLRAELTAAEHRRTTLEDALRAREAELALAREALDEARKAMADTRREGVQARRRLDVAERAAAELRDRLAAERRLREAAEQSARAELEPLVAELTGEVERLREELAAERALRLAAERATPAEAPPVAEEPPATETPRAEEPAAPPTGDDALDALIAGLRAQVASAREQLEAWDAEREEDTEPDVQAPEAPAQERPAVAQPDEETHRRLESIEADLRAAMPQPGSDIPARDVIASLQQAADRLRAAAEQELAATDRPTADEPGLAAGERPAPSAEMPAPVVEAHAAAQAAEPVAPAGGEAAPAPEPSGSGATARSVIGPRPQAPGKERPWLRVALERLAERDAPTAADVLVTLLPAQALLGQELTYVLRPDGLDPVRVAVGPGTVRVDRNPADLAAEATVSGPLAALAPLATGGAGWWLKGARIDGTRRGVRRLARDRRRPVSLADLALLTPPPAPDALLAALAAAVDPAWTVGHRFGVSYLVIDHDVPGAEARSPVLGRWTVIADDGRPLTLVENGGTHPHAATVDLSPGALLPVLRGESAPPGERAVVAGDRRAMDVLHGWFDRARGVAAA